MLTQIFSAYESLEFILIFLNKNSEPLFLDRPAIIQQVRSHADGVDRVLVSIGSCCIVFDAAIEDLPAGSFPDRPSDVGNILKTAVHELLKTHLEIEIDKDIDNKLLISVATE